MLPLPLTVKGSTEVECSFKVACASVQGVAPGFDVEVEQIEIGATFTKDK